MSQSRIFSIHYPRKFPTIGLIGEKGVGKKNIANYLVNQYGYTKIKYMQNHNFNNVYHYYQTIRILGNNGSVLYPDVRSFDEIKNIKDDDGYLIRILKDGVQCRRGNNIVLVNDYGIYDEIDKLLN